MADLGGNQGDVELTKLGETGLHWKTLNLGPYPVVSQALGYPLA